MVSEGAGQTRVEAGRKEAGGTATPTCERLTLRKPDREPEARESTGKDALPGKVDPEAQEHPAQAGRGGHRSQCCKQGESATSAMLFER